MVLANTFVPDTRVRREARALSNHGYSVKILCWDRQGTRPSRELIDNCEVQNLKFGRGTVLANSRIYFMFSALVLQFAILFSAFNLLRSGKFLMLHSHDFNTLVGSAFVKMIFFNRVKLIYDSHEFSPGVYLEWYGNVVSRVVTILERFSVQLADRIIGANSAISSYLGKLVRVSSVAIYSCPDLREVPSTSQSEARMRFGYGDEFIVLFSGRVRQDYDMDLVIDAANKIGQNGLSSKYKFVFTGPDETSATIARTVESNDLREMFEFRGWIPYDELLLLYRASSICFAVARVIGPNSKILTPIKLFESLSCGLPVLVRSGTLAANIVIERKCGIVVDGDHEDFFKTLLSLAASPDLLRVCGEAGRIAFTQEFNWKVMEQRLFGLYDSLFDGRGLKITTPLKSWKDRERMEFY
ncbi:MAG: glycosyltransferase family 4 protein [Thaumarchaeota archaeon]|nr:glycosyltransferase family 4 protein [Nitrososphaerota archaeon]